MSAFQWFSVLQTLVMVIATIVIWTLKRSSSVAVNDARIQDRLKAIENEVERLRDWRHNIMIPWQQNLMLNLDDRYLLRRDRDGNVDDSPRPQNRRRP